MEKIKLTVAAALCALALAGCATTVGARLYDLDSGQILQASFRYSGSGHGAIWFDATTPDKAACRGEYVTVPSGDVGWGTIYSGGRSATAIVTTTASDQRGRAVATCTDGTVYECEYITSAYSAKGNGSCQDNKSRRYRLMF